MITIFHGDNPTKSRAAFFKFLETFKDYEILKLDSKNINPDQINNFINGGSLFTGKKLLTINNFFSIPKANLDKIIKLFSTCNNGIVLWQDKTLTAVQLKLISHPNIFHYKADNQIFNALNALKPKNLKNFVPLYDQIIKKDLFDLFLYFLKGSFRRQLQTYSKYDKSIVIKTYLQLIELEYQYKSGQLSLSKELALKRVLIPLLR